jgi:hypothetical protein
MATSCLQSGVGGCKKAFQLLGSHYMRQVPHYQRSTKSLLDPCTVIGIRLQRERH